MRLSASNINKNGLLLLSLVVIAVVSLLTVLSDKSERPYRPGVSQTNDMAVNQALTVYRAAKVQNVDLSSGPCLSNALMEGWVLDLVHNPRQKIDHLPENQCVTSLDKPKRVVELDLDGNVMRVK